MQLILYPAILMQDLNQELTYLSPVIECAQKNSHRHQKVLSGESNLIPYPEYLYLSLSVFFVDLNAPSKQFSKAKSKLLRFEFN